MVVAEPLTVDDVRRALDLPTLRLLDAYSAWWVVPLFSQHLEFADGPVPAEWFHQKVADTLAEHGDAIGGSLSPIEHCRKWVDHDRWLGRPPRSTDGRMRYQLTDSSLRALRIVRELVTANSTVSESRLGSIAHAVQELADLTSTDSATRLARLDEQIRDLQVRRDEIEAGGARPATTEEMRRQFREVMNLMSSMPADFRALSAMVAQRHHAVAAAMSSADTRKGAMVEQFLHEHDLLAQTPEGRAYRGFAELLVSERAEQIRRDIDLVLSREFAANELSELDRAELQRMMSTLMAEEHAVQEAYTRWTASLRRFVSRSAGGRHGRLLSLVDQALEAGRELCANGPARVQVPDVLGIGPWSVRDMSQTQIWRSPVTGPIEPIETVSSARMTEADREAMLVQAGTSAKAVKATINELIARGDGQPVTGAAVFAATPPRCQRLLVLLVLVDLGLQYGQLDAKQIENITLRTRTRSRRIGVPLVVFTRPVPATAPRRSERKTA